MSHDLSLRANGSAEMAFVGNTHWHGLGQSVNKGASIGVDRPTNLYLHSVEVSEHGANSAIYVTPIEGA